MLAEEDSRMEMAVPSEDQRLIETISLRRQEIRNLMCVTMAYRDDPPVGKKQAVECGRIARVLAESVRMMEDDPMWAGSHEVHRKK